MKWFKRKNSYANPKGLDWGIATVDGFNNIENIYVHVFNSDLNSEKKRELNKVFIINKFNYYQKQLPKNSHQKFILDARGQSINIKKLRELKKEIEQIIENNHFNMEFLV